MRERKTTVLMLLCLGMGGMGCSDGGFHPFRRLADKNPLGAIRQSVAPKASRIDLTPHRADDPVGTRKVLVATLFDEQGVPRGRRKVEWKLTGPGKIVRIDEGGVLLRRGDLRDDRSATTFTGSSDRKVEGEKGSTSLGVGQTWIVVVSGVEGVTNVVAAIDGESETQARLTWSDTKMGFPVTTSVPAGGDAVLATSLSRFGVSADDLKVRYRILDGVPAELSESRKGVPDRALLKKLQTLETFPDGDGKAEVRVAQATPRAGRTRIGVEIMKAGDGPSPVIVGTGETVVEWTGSQMTLDLRAPRFLGLGADIPYELELANIGKAESRSATLEATLPEGAELVRVEPAPTSRRGQTLVWDVGTLAAGSLKTVSFTARPTQRGELKVAAAAETSDGLRATQSSITAIDVSAFTSKVTAPPSVTLEEKATATLEIRNTGSMPMEHAVAWATSEGAEPKEIPLGEIPPGNSKRVDLPLRFSTVGRKTVRVNITADGGLTDRAETTIDVKKQGQLVLSLVGPERVFVGRESIWEARLTNDGELANDVAVELSLPPGWKAKLPEEGKATEHGVLWRLPSMSAGEKKTFRVVAIPTQVRSRETIGVIATSGSLRGRADASTTVSGRPALVASFEDVPAELGSGSRTVRLSIRNDGDGAAKKIELIISTDDEVKAIAGTGADRRAARREEGRLVFETVDEIPAGATAIFQLEIEGAKAGLGRIHADIKADHLSRPVSEEQSLRVVSKPGSQEK